MKDPRVYLSKKCSEGVLAEEFLKLQQLYEKRLWHELTEELLVFVKHDQFKSGGLIELYEHFLTDFEHRINHLSLAEMILVISQEINEPEQAIQLFNNTIEKVKNSIDAKVLCLTAIGLVRIKANQLEEAKSVIKEAQDLLDGMDGVSTVHGRFYDLSSTYSKIIGSYNEYYRDALRFLGCMSIGDIPADELKQRAFNLSLAALMGSDVYNFGELLAHDVLEVMKTTEHNWLVELLFAFNSGNIDKFYSLKPQWSKQADLCANEPALLQKITLLSLMEMTFKRKSNDRSLSFQFISDNARLPFEEVEHLVMKALSLGLIKGTIDEVNHVVHITWVQPRVLDKEQMKSLRDHLLTWAEKVKSTSYMVEDQVPELLVN